MHFSTEKVQDFVVGHIFSDKKSCTGICKWPRPEDKPLAEFIEPPCSQWCHMIIDRAPGDRGLWEVQKCTTLVTDINVCLMEYAI